MGTQYKAKVAFCSSEKKDHLLNGQFGKTSPPSGRG